MRRYCLRQAVCGRKNQLSVGQWASGLFLLALRDQNPAYFPPWCANHALFCNEPAEMQTVKKATQKMHPYQGSVTPTHRHRPSPKFWVCACLFGLDVTVNDTASGCVAQTPPVTDK